jgi:hypothetical protein
MSSDSICTPTSPCVLRLEPDQNGCRRIIAGFSWRVPASTSRNRFSASERRDRVQLAALVAVKQIG